MKNFLVILQIVPALIQIIKTVEEMFPLPGAGKEKLTLVREMLSSIYAGLDEIWPVIETIVGKVVEFANNIGAFKK